MRFRHSFLTVLLIGLSACDALPPGVEIVQGGTNDEPITWVVSGNNQAQIIGANDLRPVVKDGAELSDGTALAARYRPLADAFGIISPVGCTATHIGDGLVLTAGHCFMAGSAGLKDKPCDGTTVKWGVRKDDTAYLTSDCTRLVDAKLSGHLDYAIFRVSPVPTAKVEIDLTNRPPVGHTLTIFGHPKRRPLEWSGVCKLAAGTTAGANSKQFGHQCDTEPGSSGSTILDDTTVRVMGIHSGGSSAWNVGGFLIDTPLGTYVGAPPPPPPSDMGGVGLPDLKPATDQGAPNDQGNVGSADLAGGQGPGNGSPDGSTTQPTDSGGGCRMAAGARAELPLSLLLLIGLVVALRSPHGGSRRLERVTSRRR